MEEESLKLWIGVEGPHMVLGDGGHKGSRLRTFRGPCIRGRWSLEDTCLNMSSSAQGDERKRGTRMKKGTGARERHRPKFMNDKRGETRRAGATGAQGCGQPKAEVVSGGAGNKNS